MAKKEKKPKTEEPEAEAPAAGEEGAAPAKKKMAGKTLVLFIILPALLVLGGGGAAAFILLGGKPAAHAEAGKDGEHKPTEKKKKDDKKEAEKKDAHGGHGEAKDAKADAAPSAGGIEVGTLTVGEDGQPSYYTMPDIIVNLAGGSENDRPLFLKLGLVLEASDPGSFDEMTSMMPRVVDQFQTFLRELRVEDLNGSAGSYRLRLELLKRFNTVMAPAKIDAVLIQNILVQ
ncbi:MAG: flagellar basal body-associated protein FliL [Alphaproteobacteria bacterium]|nr:flagellar basal body-associated protein FliL [Alphaproteobacteria bacterium]